MTNTPRSARRPVAALGHGDHSYFGQPVQEGDPPPCCNVVRSRTGTVHAFVALPGRPDETPGTHYPNRSSDPRASTRKLPCVRVDAPTTIDVGFAVHTGRREAHMSAYVVVHFNLKDAEQWKAYG